MRVPPLLLPLLFVLSIGSGLHADTAVIRLEGQSLQTLDSGSTDYVRENLVHIFDSAQFHHMEGGRLEILEQKEIKKRLDRVESSSFFKLSLDEPAVLMVEGKKLRARKLWARIRESDGLVYDWILEQEDETLVYLNKASGDLMVQFAPYVRTLVDKYKNLQGSTHLNIPTTVK